VKNNGQTIDLRLQDEIGTLDPVIQARLLGWLAARSRAGRTIFFSSHVLAEVEELCDHVAMIRSGRLLFVGRLGELRRSRVRSVEVTFSEPVDPARYAGEGVGTTEVEGAHHRFSLSGDPAPLLAALSRLPVADVAIERASLEDAFRDLYAT